MKSFPILTFLYLIAITALGQTVFPIDSIPQEGILPLHSAWKWHLGDNPNWSKPTFDDSAWQSLEPTQEMTSLNQLPQEGMGWLRIHLQVAPGLRGKVMGIFLIQSGANEIFLNGRLVSRSGEISAQKRLKKGTFFTYTPLFQLSNDSAQVIAVRYVFSRKQLTKHPIQFFYMGLCLPETGESKIDFFREERQIINILLGSFLILGILQLLLYATSTAQRTNLYFGLFLLAQCVTHYCLILSKDPDVIPHLFGITNPVLFIDRLTLVYLIFAIVSTFFFQVGIYQYFKQSKGKAFWVTTAFNLASIPTVLLAPANEFIFYFSIAQYILAFIIPYLDILRVGLVAIRQQKSGAKAFTLVHTVNLIAFGFEAATDFFPLNDFLGTNTIYFQFLSFLSLAITISLLLSQERIATNKLLRKQLADLEALSRKNIVQEQEKQQLLATQNERLEQQVEARTAELKASQVQLIQKEKLASLGELTAGIAHEIQNPLNFVNNFSEVSSELIEELKEEIQAGHTEDVLAIADDLTRNLQKINHHGGRASSIVKGMLEHSRTESGEKRLTDLNVLADEYLKIAYHGLRAKDKSFNCELVTDFDTSLESIEIAPQEIGRVLLNLYNNAFYAVSERAKQRDESEYKPKVEVLTHLQANQLVIQVQDNGTGIPDSVKAKIFQPFFTTKPTGEGTGLGLSLSYDIITKGHGGTLTVERSEGNGTTFVIQLPA